MTTEVETLELEDHVSGPLGEMASQATRCAEQVSVLRSRLSGIVASGAQELVAAFGEAAGKESIMSVQLEGIAAAERAVSSEVQRQIALEAQIATFDANRVRQVHALEEQYAAMRKQALGLNDDEGKSNELADALGRRFFSATAAVQLTTEALRAAERVLAAMVREAATLTYEGAKLAVEMSNAKSESIRIFDTFTHSKVAAGEMYEQVKALANITGEAPEAVADRMRRLLAEGLSPELARHTLQAQADIFAALGDKQASQFEEIVEKLHNRGALDSRMMKTLAAAGIDTQSVYASLASHLHESIDKVKADLKAGTIAGDEAASAIADAVEGKFGGAAKARGENDALIMLARIRNDARALFEDIDISPIKEAEKSLIGVLEGAGGKELAAGLQDMFGSLFHTIFDPFKGPEGAKKLENFMHGLSVLAHEAGAAFRAAAPYVQTFVDAINGWTRNDQGPSKLERWISALQKIKALLAAIIDPLGMLGSSPDARANDFGKAIGVGVPETAPAGAQMTNGLISGIEGGQAGVVSALVSVCTSAVKAAEVALGIHSPSRVFAEIGTMTAAGFAQGIAANDSAPASASAAMARGAASAAVSAPSSRGSAGPGGAVSVNVTMPPIVIHANDAQGGAEAAAAAAPIIQQAHREAATQYWRDWREAG